MSRRSIRSVCRLSASVIQFAPYAAEISKHGINFIQMSFIRCNFRTFPLIKYENRYKKKRLVLHHTCHHTHNLDERDKL